MKRATLFLISATAIAFVALFSGCGQSGPLYVPGNPTKMAVPPAREDISEEDEEESEPPE